MTAHFKRYPLNAAMSAKSTLFYKLTIVGRSTIIDRVIEFIELSGHDSKSYATWTVGRNEIVVTILPPSALKFVVARIISCKHCRDGARGGAYWIEPVNSIDFD